MNTIPPVTSTERGLLSRVALGTAAVVTLIAVAAGVVGAQLSSLAAQSAVEERATLLAVMTSARLRATPEPRVWAAVADRTTARVGGIVTVTDPEGRAIAGADESPLEPRSPLLHVDRGRGEVSFGDRNYFVVTEALPALDQQPGYHLVVAVLHPKHPGNVPDLLLGVFTVMAALGALGVGAALIVARDIETDVRAIARSALRMAAGEAAALEPLPVRSHDEVGGLVAAFNRLQRRFTDEVEAHRAALVRLEDAERRKEALIATLRHELRTPLNSIIGFAELLLSGVDGELSVMQREDVEVIARSGRHLLHLVDDVLDLSAIASGRFVIDAQPVDLVGVVREVVREAAGSARRRGVTLRADGVPNALVEGDPTSLRRAITNLVQNAIQHAGGEVVVDVQVRGQSAEVAVRDNGRGISPGELKRLFKPFERGRTGEQSRAGAGLGLAITVALLELHGGTLAAESVVGAGSTFRATLPLRPTALSQAGFV